MGRDKIKHIMVEILSTHLGKGEREREREREREKERERERRRPILSIIYFL